MFRVVLAAIAILGFVQQAPPAGTAVVAGQVIDATSKQPVAGALVTLSPPPATPNPGGAPPAPPPPSAIKRAVTNTDGRFVFRAVTAGTYSLAATRNGYSPGATGRRRPGGQSRSFTVADGARVTDATIPIWRMPTITGMVRDDRGQPAVGVAVSAMRRTMTGGRAELAFSGGEHTDDRGHYRIFNLEPGSYVVAARTNPQSAAVSTVDRYRAAAASGTAAQISRELREGGALQMATEGIVIDGWQVSTSSEKTTMMPGPNGTLLLSPLTFYGGTGSAADATVLTLAPGDDRVGIDFTFPLVAGVRVSGSVTGLDRPAASYGVQLVPVASGSLSYPFPVAYSITDEAGRFAILGVPPGSYTVKVSRVPPGGPLFTPAAPGAGAPAGRESMTVTVPPLVSYPSMFAEASVTVGSAHVDGVSLTFQPGAKLSGRAVFEGAAAPPAGPQLQRVGVVVRSVYGGDSRGAGGQTMLDASGAFQTPEYAPGRYLVTAVAGAEWTLASVRVGGVDASDQAITLGTTDFTDVVVTFTDKPMTMAGSVRAADSSADVEATVIAFPADHKTWISNRMSPRRLAIGPTSATGAYQLRVGLPGEYLLVAIPPEILPEVDPEFIARFAATATRVTIAVGETKTQALTVSRVR